VLSVVVDMSGLSFVGVGGAAAGAPGSGVGSQPVEGKLEGGVTGLEVVRQAAQPGVAGPAYVLRLPEGEGVVAHFPVRSLVALDDWYGIAMVSSNASADEVADRLLHHAVLAAQALAKYAHRANPFCGF
jgi:hypothetical protein